MDKLEHYCQCLRKFLANYIDYGAQREGLETQVIIDTTNDHYLLLRIGWDKNKRIHTCIFHFDIKDGKIWVQENNTDIEIDRDLEEMGISKQELVIGFHHPSMREFSDYAIA
ncbi:XisI protein [Alkalinema pantanalense CENA528]|uniref:XisI protein n=1 Tax=Alkalinema pantanalense TaxID=1620705 RepID=UPI003D6EFAD5